MITASPSFRTVAPCARKTVRVKYIVFFVCLFVFSFRFKYNRVIRTYQWFVSFLDVNDSDVGRVLFRVVHRRVIRGQRDRHFGGRLVLRQHILSYSVVRPEYAFDLVLRQQFGEFRRFRQGTVLNAFQALRVITGVSNKKTKKNKKKTILLRAAG